MLSQTGIYALQAVVHLAQQPPKTSVSAALMARRLSVPSNYLAKVLHRLTGEGLLRSIRGSRGGYRLAVLPEDLSVEDVVGPFEELRTPVICILGGPCDEEAPCPAHARRLEWIEARRRLLRQTKVVDLLSEEGTTNVDGGAAAVSQSSAIGN
jgi:Rrf2 family protein